MKTMNQEQAAGNPDDEPMTRKELATLFHAMGALVKKEGIDCERPSIPVSLKPEFIRINDAAKLFGIKRGKLYQMMAEGTIKSVNLKSRGSTTGVRLISYDHLKGYLDSLLE